MAWAKFVNGEDGKKRLGPGYIFEGKATGFAEGLDMKSERKTPRILASSIGRRELPFTEME